MEPESARQLESPKSDRLWLLVAGRFHLDFNNHLDVDMKRSNMTIFDLARLCDVTPQEVVKAFAAGTVKGKITDGPTVRITKEAAMKFLLENKNAALAVYTTGQAAKLCNLSLTTITRCFDSGIIKGFKVPRSKHRRIPLEAMVEFMVEHDIPYGGKNI